MNTEQHHIISPFPGIIIKNRSLTNSFGIGPILYIDPGQRWQSRYYLITNGAGSIRVRGYELAGHGMARGVMSARSVKVSTIFCGNFYKIQRRCLERRRSY